MADLKLTPSQLAFTRLAMEQLKLQMETLSLSELFGFEYDLAGETQLATDFQAVLDQLDQL